MTPKKKMNQHSNKMFLSQNKNKGICLFHKQGHVTKQFQMGTDQNLHSTYFLEALTKLFMPYFSKFSNVQI